jgi:hypothetical protein
MAVDVRLRQFVVAILLAAVATTVCAEENPLDLRLPASKYYSKEAKSFMLAENDTSISKTKSNTAAVTPAAEFEPKLITGKSIHQYLGLGTIALAGLTMITKPGEACEHNCSAVVQQPREVNGTHAQFAKATVAMAEAAIISGLITHWDDFSLEDGWTDPDNLHVLLGVTGAALMAYAVEKSATSSTPVSHAGLAELGALGMLFAIKLTW